MKFFVDTADVAEIKELAATGVLDGVTTNPSLVAKAKRTFARSSRRSAPRCPVL